MVNLILTIRFNRNVFEIKYDSAVKNVKHPPSFVLYIYYWIYIIICTCTFVQNNNLQSRRRIRSFLLCRFVQILSQFWGYWYKNSVRPAEMICAAERLVRKTNECDGLRSAPSFLPSSLWWHIMKMSSVNRSCSRPEAFSTCFYLTVRFLLLCCFISSLFGVQSLKWQNWFSRSVVKEVVLNGLLVATNLTPLCGEKCCSSQHSYSLFSSR